MVAADLTCVPYRTNEEKRALGHLIIRGHEVLQCAAICEGLECTIKPQQKGTR